MRGLKILVVVMGVLIIIGFGTIVVTLVSRLIAPAGGAREVAIPLPPSAHIEAIYGSGDRLVLDLGADGADARTHRRLMVVDPATGTISRFITIKPSGS